MAEFHFLRPLWLVALLPLGALWWGIWRHQATLDDWAALIDRKLLPHLLVGGEERRLVRPVHLLLAVWVTSVFALAGPAWQKERSPFLSDEAGLMIVLKVSESMNSADVQPSRLERARLKIRDVLETRRGGEAGLVVYSGSAHLVMPLTRDERIINTMLEELDSDVMPVEGDKLSDGLELAEQMVLQSGLSGSILVVADSSADTVTTPPALPVQILAIQPVNATVDAGLARAADTVGAALVRMTNDRGDTDQIVRRAETRHRDVSEPGQDEKWKDGGYLLLPLLAAGMLVWFRKGWELT